MAKLRHVAMNCPDPEKTAKFYCETFGMKIVGETKSELADGVYLSDGVMSLALLKYKSDKWAGKAKDAWGVHHLGFWCENAEEQEAIAQKNGATFFQELPLEKDSLYYEKKFRDPDGQIFDISENGWVGAKK